MISVHFATDAGVTFDLSWNVNQSENSFVRPGQLQSLMDSSLTHATPVHQVPLKWGH